MPKLSNKYHPTVPISDNQQHFLRQEIVELILKKAIEKVLPNSSGFSSPLFVIPKRNGGHQLVFNLKKLNEHIKIPHFKMETLQNICKLICPHDYLTSLDLSNAFLHILVVYQSDPSSTRMGSNLGNTKIAALTIATTGTFELSFGHQEHNFQNSRCQIEGFTIINMTTDTTQISNSLFGPQSHNADPGSHDHTLSGQTLHATLDVWECNISQWNDQSRLSQQNKHVLFVDASSTRWRCALGDKAIYRYWSHQEATMSINWQEMKVNEQHYLNGVPEQAGWLQGLLSDDSDSQDIEAVSAPWVEVDSPAYSRQGECGGRFSISLHIYKELVKAVLSSFSSYPTDMGSLFHGLICSLADPPSPNFCFMETRPKGNSNRRNVDTMVSMG
ncbi:hypothetical protein PHYBLDRAFT_139471 [Phycomyces blakesleeanus NRRL 1555(-)]|uniref:Reverse transcriptase domain-containing protein n=1 Tax=Phycomyces blakesleeanus (strain ATCC 8743b / DSM 1359 / FGSC 10004 / NBRC 33097 / NRRL 1555) TaxID=763407 RepID=A0A162V1X6_PHYB8|nr:hypothetical protein PHYBLDRAFT_139471 [Phycomyces blakesleeanus NRRL 1555(-)]OAD79442.1 hypothetical protein PHYBLDRAFT_139471 [Phycomyces blakesleeanus NRRL 1555(-)]|eukprot:XP_018297482.1 hypothetical protein PHYBLDRAFT_139471 [Phycomyces blakesleeanus NRRL 1555(-)]